MNDLLRKGISLGLGVTMAGKEKIEAFVEDLVKKGELAPSDSKMWVSSLVERGENEREELKHLVREQLQKLLRDLHVASKEDLARLEERVARLETTISNQSAEPSYGEQHSGENTSTGQ